MPFSEPLKVTFIHIPKTGGSSIEKSLGMVTSEKWGTQKHFEEKYNNLFNYKQHYTFKQIRKYHQDWLNRSDLILVTVREPLERIYSHYIARNGQWLNSTANYNIYNFYFFVFFILPLVRFSYFAVGNMTRIMYSQYEHLIPQSQYVGGLLSFAASNSKKLIFISLFAGNSDKISDLLSSELGYKIDIPHLRKSNSDIKIKRLRSTFVDKFIKYMYRCDYQFLNSIDSSVNTNSISHKA